MRLEIFILGLTAFFIYNAYHDGKYLKMLMTFKKYYKMIFYAFLGIGIYLILKRNPQQGRNMLLYANNVVKFMPIDKTSMDMLSPIFDFTDNHSQSFMESYNGIDSENYLNLNDKNILQPNKPTKRAVNGMTKKYVASQQEWKCGHCKEQLDHTFEVDHKIRLEYGGSNDKTNLIALCRNCHGKKTAMEMMDNL
jgi:hypothetical protein